MIEELKRHGYSLSPGTLYPLLHKMDDAGHLASRSETVCGKIRKYYRITSKGKTALAAGFRQATELLAELQKTNITTRQVRQQ
jgi:DNA-binding PadR family transcriptional regulator